MNKVCRGSGPELKGEWKDEKFDDLNHHFAQSPLSHFSFDSDSVTPKKERGKIRLRSALAYRLLNSKISKAKTAIMATIMPADTGMKYKSAADAGEVVGGAVAAGASFTFR